jgi:polar amino acid transport system permease protein
MSNSIRSFGTRRAVLAGFLLLLALSVTACSGQAKGATYHFQWDITLKSIFQPDDTIINGLRLTIVISIVAQVLGVILGIFAALGRMSRVVPFRILANLYIWFFRGTPLIVQLTFLFYGLLISHVLVWPTLVLGPVTIGPEILAGTLILGINEGAYMAEIVRAGILAVDPGQTEAAKSLGMPYRKTMSRIVLPQAARVIIPPLGNEFNNMIKNTSLLYVLAVLELYTTFENKATNTFQYFEFFVACCFWYLLLTTIWGFVQAWIERKFAKGTLQTTGGGPSWRERLFARGKVGVVDEEIRVLGGH